MKTKEVKQAYEYWKNVMVNRDFTSIDKICDDNFSWTNSMGITNNKGNLYKVASGNIRYLSWINEDFTINIIGDIATLTTREVLKLIVYNQRVNTAKDVIVLFMRQNGKWKLVAGQETDKKKLNRKK